MVNKEVIELFFSRNLEEMYNEYILDDKDYVVPKGALDHYVNTILSVPYSEFINYIKENRTSLKIESKNITQCSSFEACEIEMCNALLNDGNKGLGYVEIGKLFPNYVNTDNKVSFQKFGENQIKTAAQLGLVFEYYDSWFLSCLGYVYPDLSVDVRNSLLARTLLRDALYATITADLTVGNVCLLSYMTSISSSKTKERRYSNVAMLENICIQECIKENIAIGKIIDSKSNISNSATDAVNILPGKTVLLKQQINIPLLTEGITIPCSMHKVWAEYLNNPGLLCAGASSINLIVDKKHFKATLRILTKKEESTVLQICYAENNPIALYFREVFNSSYELVNGEYKLMSSEFGLGTFEILAANRNDTLYITTEPIEAIIEHTEKAALYQGEKDIDYYKGCFRDISISGEIPKIIIGKLCMLSSFIEYVRWLHNSYGELTNRIPILASWEGFYLQQFARYFDAKRKTTLFSSPFILLDNEPFWSNIYEEDAKLPTEGKHAMMTFVNIQNTFSGVEVEFELLELLLKSDSSKTLYDYILNLLEKYRIR